MSNQSIIHEIQTEGGFIIKNVIPTDDSKFFAKYITETELKERSEKEAFLDDTRKKGHIVSAKGVGSISNFDPILPKLSKYLIDKNITNTAENLIGKHFRISTIGGLVNFPGNERGYWHADWPFNQTVASHVPAPYPNAIMHLSCLIMLTKFTDKTGGTLIVPRSHLIPDNPSSDMGDESKSSHPNEINIVGNPGDVFLYDSRLWHSVAENRDPNPRIAISVRYAPWWLNLNVQEQGHPDRQRIVLKTDGKDSLTRRISKSVFSKLPDEAKPLFMHFVDETMAE